MQFYDATLCSGDTRHRPFVPKQSAVAIADVDNAGVLHMTTPDASGMMLVTKALSDATKEKSATIAMTAPLPSKHRIGSIVRASTKDSGDAAFVASDTVGNVFCLEANSGDVVDHKRMRGEVGAAMLLSSRDAEAMPGAFDIGGAAGLAVLQHVPAFSHQLVVAREHFRDVRVFSSLRTNTMVRSLYPMHSPRALSVADDAPLLALAEGPVASLWDLRAAQPCVHRITTNDAVADVVFVGTQLFVGSENRSVSTYDARKWAKVASLQGITKHPIGNIVPSRDGARCVVVGTDTEAKLVSLVDKVQSVTEQQASHSFRQKFENTVNCDYAWHGRWAANEARTAAVGMSATGEVFFLPKF